MARSRVGIKGTNQRRIRQSDQDSDESDEEYKVTDDEDFDESDDCYSLDGDESEDISTDFRESKRVSRSRNARRTSGKKVNGIKRHRKRRVSYTEDDDDDDDEVDDEEFLPWDKEANQGNKPMEKKRVSYTAYTEVEDDDGDDGGGDDDDGDDGGGGEDYRESVFSGRNRKQRKKPREKKRVVYTEDEDEDGDEEEDDDDDDDDDDEEEEEEEEEGEDDAEFMSLDRENNQVYTPMEKKDSYTKVNDDEDDGSEEYKESVFSGRNRKQRKNPWEKKRVVHTEEEEEEEEDDDDDDDDDDYDEEEEEEVADEDDGDFISLGGKANQIKTRREMKKGSYKETDDDDEEEEEEDDDDDDYAEFVSSGRKRNQRKKPRGKKVVYTEDDEDDEEDDEFMYSGGKPNLKNNLQEKREVSYTEEEADGDDDSGFMSSSMKRNQINNRRDKGMVSYKEDNQEEEDENDAEFKLSESDFVDDEDETPKIKPNKVTRSHPQKKSVRGRQKKSKKSTIKKPTKPKQRNHRFGQKLGTSKEKSVSNKTKMENRSKISKKRKHRADWQRPTAESDSDFVDSASSDHDYTISEEEREQMREARVYCANLRAKLRSSSCGNQEKQPTYEQKKYPIRKGKEKIDDMKDDIGKQVCGICLSEEQKRTMRGVLNCCRHYFCFSCIMEWSKVESRCPLCKQRFTTITKAAKSDTGFDLRTVVIPVPECDQVYEPSEEELRGYLDPYESVICTECQNGGDDALMLLCDICDSSAHTFCVGLGREVPEGNWYCEGCRPTVFGTLNSDRRLSNNAPDLSSSSPIPGSFDLNELYVPETPLTQQTRVLPEPNPASTGTAATTLRDRRRLHRQIHHLGILNNNRMNDLVARSSGTSASSSGIRLFGSQLDQARVSDSQNDHIFSSMHDHSSFYPRTEQFSVQVQNSNLAPADVALQDEHVALPEFKI